MDDFLAKSRAAGEFTVRIKSSRQKVDVEFCFQIEHTIIRSVANVVSLSTRQEGHQSKDFLFQPHWFFLSYERLEEGPV